jgi:competence protein ComEC
MVVYSDNKNLHVDFVNGKNHSVYSTDYSSIERVASNYWLASKLNDPILLENSSYYKDGFLRFQNKTILILSTDMLDDKTNEMPFVVDFLIIGNSLKPRINELLSCLNPKTIIVDKTISDWYTESIRRQCVEEGIHFYSIAENGAFTLNFKH